MTQVLEGTWEEIAAHAPEWNGKRLRVAVEVLETLQDAKSNESAKTDEVSVADLIGDIVGSVSFLPNDLSERHSEALSEILEEKQRAGKL